MTAISYEQHAAHHRAHAHAHLRHLSLRPSHRRRLTGLMIGKVGEIGDVQSEITASICTVTGTICKFLSFIYHAHHIRCRAILSTQRAAVPAEERAILTMLSAVSGVGELSVQEDNGLLLYGLLVCGTSHLLSRADAAFVVAIRSENRRHLDVIVMRWDGCDDVGDEVITMKQMLEASPHCYAAPEKPGQAVQIAYLSRPRPVQPAKTLTLEKFFSMVKQNRNVKFCALSPDLQQACGLCSSGPDVYPLSARSREPSPHITRPFESLTAQPLLVALTSQTRRTTLLHDEEL
ncbi:hypothetical protein DL98DRAFT_572355 [Cadophora sp. DSE1049]|nr:hypothetical protein DL98DRAFT_572355 [Cadophora sp. DSE1049]